MIVFVPTSSAPVRAIRGFNSGDDKTNQNSIKTSGKISRINIPGKLFIIFNLF